MDLARHRLEALCCCYGGSGSFDSFDLLSLSNDHTGVPIWAKMVVVVSKHVCASVERG